MSPPRVAGRTQGRLAQVCPRGRRGPFEAQLRQPRFARTIMILGRVIGTVVATRKDERLVSTKLLVVRLIDPRGHDESGYLVAVDTVDAGARETVLVVSGSSARMASGLKDCPVDAAIVGVIDAIEVKE